MIKLFRNIRKNLINEGKTANYLKYAIGEIVLVLKPKTQLFPSWEGTKGWVKP